jgi:hypothetical protein
MFTSRAEMVRLIVEQLLDLSDRVTPSPVLLIDGRAGAGKSSIAEEIMDGFFQTGDSKPALVHLDDVYPGWSGLRSGAMYATHNILQPLAAGRSASWQLWNWETGERGREEPGNGWREFRGGTPLIIEGCGSISRLSKPLANLTLWIEADEATRRERWSKRDGDRFNEYWSIWAEQEAELIAIEQPAELADYLLLNL